MVNIWTLSVLKIARSALSQRIWRLSFGSWRSCSLMYSQILLTVCGRESWVSPRRVDNEWESIIGFCEIWSACEDLLPSWSVETYMETAIPIDLLLWTTFSVTIIITINTILALAFFLLLLYNRLALCTTTTSAACPAILFCLQASGVCRICIFNRFVFLMFLFWWRGIGDFGKSGWLIILRPRWTLLLIVDSTCWGIARVARKAIYSLALYAISYRLRCCGDRFCRLELCRLQMLLFSGFIKAPTDEVVDQVLQESC